MTFRLVDNKIDTSALTDALLSSTSRSSEAGALATFEGRVRDFNEGQKVSSLAYEAYPELATSEGEKIVAEAKEKFNLIDALCVHRTGQLTIGDTAVVVICTSPHRQEAFTACRYIIDEVKARLPIWKREVYSEGHQSWVNCSQHAETHSHNHRHPELSSVSALSEKNYYERQALLPLIGLDGQQKLKEKKVLVIGAGGLGSPALLYLAGAGVGTIGICEFDQVEISNLHRQILYGTTSLNSPKLLAAKERIEGLNPFVKVNLHASAFVRDNGQDILAEYDLVLDATDSLENKLLINAVAFDGNKPLIQASVYQFEGQLSFFQGDRANGGRKPHSGQCMGCLWHDRLLAEEGLSCQTTGIIGATTGVFGSLQAMEAIKYLLGLDSPLRTHLLLFDLLSLQSTLVERTIRQSCIVCGQIDAPLEDGIELGCDALQELVAYELLPAHYSKLMSEFSFAPEKKYLLYCQSGRTSREKAKALRSTGLKNVFSLRGGLALNPTVVNFLKDERELMPANAGINRGTKTVESGEHHE
jgi:adenylyltransferase/sulfurtransferase